MAIEAPAPRYLPELETPTRLFILPSQRVERSLDCFCRGFSDLSENNLRNRLINDHKDRFK
jgi:hypothetical protein